MNHFTLPAFWRYYRQLPNDVRDVADKNFQLLREDSQHPSVQLKKVGSSTQLWSARVGLHYRALGLDKPEGIMWFWIGSHATYDQILAKE
jgi:hypothetical protein